jgi:hypothetical protein
MTIPSDLEIEKAGEEIANAIGKLVDAHGKKAVMLALEHSNFLTLIALMAERKVPRDVAQMIAGHYARLMGFACVEMGAGYEQISGIAKIIHGYKQTMADELTVKPPEKKQSLLSRFLQKLQEKL